MNYVYVVIGTRGSWSDTHQWPAAVVSTEEEAKKTVVEFKEQLEYWKNTYPMPDRADWEIAHNEPVRWRTIPVPFFWAETADYDGSRLTAEIDFSSDKRDWAYDDEVTFYYKKAAKL